MKEFEKKEKILENEIEQTKKKDELLLFPPMKKLVSRGVFINHSINSPLYSSVFLMRKKIENANEGNTFDKTRAIFLGKG